MLAEHEKSLSRVLPTSRVGYHADKPIDCVGLLKMSSLTAHNALQIITQNLLTIHATKSI